MPDIHKIFSFLKKTFRFQEKRMAQFEQNFQPKSGTTILDVGGYYNYWMTLKTLPQVTLLNVGSPRQDTPKQFNTIIGDGRKLPYPDQSFDIAFSSSVIEHVGDVHQQQCFVAELRRVGRSYYVQIPYRWSLIEPHFLIFFFHWLPKPIYKFLVCWFSPWTWITKATTAEVSRAIDEVSLVSMRDMRTLFPDAEIYRERVCGFTKSLIAMKRKAEDSVP